MGLRFCSIASGSTGNSYVVRTEDTAVLIDCGISGKRIIAGLEALGLDPGDLDAILLTHEHTDHILSIKMMARKAPGAEVFASEGTITAISDKIKPERATAIEGDSSFRVGDIDIDAFDLSHDAIEPVGYSLKSGGSRLSIITDTGIVTDDIYSHIKDSDGLILEANHEVNILRAGPYPYELQQRILGEQGHLSNVTAGETIARVLDSRESEKPPLYVMLAHVSRHNNTPEVAYLTVKNVLFEEGHYVDKEVKIGVARHDEMSPEIEI